MSSSTNSPLHLNPLAAALCGALLSTAPGVMAQQSSITTLTPVQVQGTAPGFKPEAVQSSKFVQPLLDTPQSISVVPAEVLREQNAQSLQEILSNVPGITFSSGEGGAGWGDMFTIRGFSAEQSVTFDGVRNSALSTRTDVFNIDQVEVFKGTGSIESGVAAIGGSVNLVEKAPRLGNFYDATLGLGTDSYRRATVDLNHQTGETTAFRLNAMTHHNDVARRGEADMQRWGVAPSLAFGLGTPTRVTLKYFHQRDQNTPDFGLPVARGTNGRRQQWIGKDFWGGLRNADTEITTNDAATILVEHDISTRARVRNQTRWAQTERFTYLTTGGRLLNAPAGAQPGDTTTNFNTNDYWGYSRGGALTYPSGYLAMPRLQGNMNSYRGRILANQTDLNLDFDTAGLKHKFVTGLELYRESYRKQPYSRSVPDIDGRRVIDVRHPDTWYEGEWREAFSTDRSGAEVTNIGVYAYDSIELNEKWELSGGMRFDRFRVKWFDVAGATQSFEQEENVWSGRVGVVYKPVPHGSIYAAYSQASQPSAAAAASRSGGGLDDGDVQFYSPGKAKTYEVGTKWDLLDERLSLTGAVFQVERSNPTDIDPDDPLGAPVQLGGKDRVRGFEVGVAGNITSKWSAFAGYSMLRSKILEGEPEDVGGKMKNVPSSTFNLWTTYAFTPKWNASLGLQHVGKRRFTAGNTAAARAPISSGTVSADEYMPGYWVANAAVGYQLNRSVGLRLNINNIFDKFYYAQGSSSSDGFQLFGVPGAGRTVILSADLRY